MEDGLPHLSFEAQVIHWRGPPPYFFAPVPEANAGELRQALRLVTYGWGMIPVEATIGDVAFKTSLFPKDGTYLLPLKDIVRRKANITAGDVVAVEMTLQPRWR